MTISEFYKAIDGDYEDTLARFRNETMILKFLGMFLRDPSMENLRNNLNEGNDKEAFRAAHTLKGVAANMGMTAMQQAASDVTEALRGGDVEAAKLLMPRLDEIYNKTKDALNSILGE